MTLDVDEAILDDVRGRVRQLLRTTAATAILPRFGQLRQTEITEKKPGELVTIADRQSEQILTEGLLGLLANSRVIGEEASEADPHLLDGADKGLVWLVDPLDGTANFAAGRGPFGVIVALAADGEIVSGWLYDPMADRICFAAKDRGAWMEFGNSNPEPLRVKPPSGRPVASLATQFMPPHVRDGVERRAAETLELQAIPRCAAEHYPRLCLGKNDVALFQRTLPWDHAAGALLLTEAGGCVRRWNGQPYQFHDKEVGILAATSNALWDDAADLLLRDAALQAHARTLLPQTLDFEAR